MELLLWLIGGDWIEFKIVLGIAIVVAVLWFFRGTSWGLGIAAGVAALLGANMLARQGWEQKAKKDNRDAEKLIDRAVKSRKKAEEIARKHPDKLRDDDGFRRD
jgi:hypothetical protein